MGAQILSVQEQHGSVNLWATVDTEAETEKITVDVYGTGHSLPVDEIAREHMATVQVMGGSGVYHFFKRV